MAARDFLPRAQAPIAAGATPSPEYYDFFLRLADEQGGSVDYSAQIAALDGRVDEVENTVSGFSITGPGSVLAFGQFSQGPVIVTLENDDDAPVSFAYYGTNTSGTKGWHPVADAVDAADGIQKTVSPEGLSTFSPVGNLASVHGLSTLGFTIRNDDDNWETRVFNVAGDATLTDDGSAITITVESYPPELGYGGV